MLAPVDHHALIEDVLGEWREHLGEDAPGYRGHVYRVFNLARALVANPTTDDLLALAAAFHDLGIWTDRTFDYLDPSMAHARRYLARHRSSINVEAVCDLIEWHHKLLPIDSDATRPVEAFRCADLADLSWGLVRFGLPLGFFRDLQAMFPNAGFHRCLFRVGTAWIAGHPERPLPVLRW